MDEGNVVDDNLNTSGEVDTSSTNETEENIDDVKAELAETKEKLDKSEKNYGDQKIRAEKAEKASKPKETTEDKPKQEETLAPKDYLALTEAQVKADDFDEVVGWSKFKGITIAEALKDKTLGTILKDRAEERATAEATHTKKTARSQTTPSADKLVEQASQGQLPDSDEGIEALADARLAIKKK